MDEKLTERQAQLHFDVKVGHVFKKMYYGADWKVTSREVVPGADGWLYTLKKVEA